MKKRIVIISIAAVILVGAIIGVTALLSRDNADKPLTAAELLDLGEKYLLELDYEQAIVQFLNVIEIEPRNTRAYLGAAEAYVALGQHENAREILELGYERTGDEHIKQMLDELASQPETIRTLDFAEIAVGNIIPFGGHDWRVLDVQDGKALILSENILEIRTYHNTASDITWVGSDLSAYLNGEFFDSFDESDRLIIANAVNQNLNNSWFGTNGGPDTQDKIFVLSLDEVIRYFGDSGDLSNQNGGIWVEGDEGDLIFQHTEGGSFINDEYNANRIALYRNNYPGWWLRSPGVNSNSAVYVCGIDQVGINGNGTIFVYGLNVDSHSGIRPALWLNISDEAELEPSPTPEPTPVESPAEIPALSTPEPITIPESTPEPTATPQPSPEPSTHAFAAALQEIMQTAYGRTNAVLVDIDGDGSLEMISIDEGRRARDDSHWGEPASGTRLTVNKIINGEITSTGVSPEMNLQTHDVYISNTNTIVITENFEMGDSHQIFTFSNAVLTKRAELSDAEDWANDTTLFYMNGQLVDEAQYAGLLNEFGVGSIKIRLIANRPDRPFVDNTTEILSMTAGG